MTPSSYIRLARLLRPQGRRGELLAELHTSTPDLLSRPEGVFLVSADAACPTPETPRIHIESHWMPTGRNAGRIVVKLAGCDSISAAELLAGRDLLIPASERPALEPGTFYVSDLIGATLFNAATPIGEILDIEFATTPDGRHRLEDAAPLLVVHPANAPATADPLLIPFVQAHLDAVDLPNRRITMHLPEGLLDLTTPPPA